MTTRGEVLAGLLAEFDSLFGLDHIGGSGGTYVVQKRHVDALRGRLAAALAAQEGDQGDAYVLGDHPHIDPGDGRTECYLCGKFVHDVIHSCKGVPVTRAAEHRVRALIDAVRADVASPDVGDAVRAVAAVEAVLAQWRTDRLAYPTDDPRASVAFIAVKQCEEELRAALADTTGALAEVNADAWHEGFEAAVEWVERCGRPADIGPPDPPLNPYEPEAAGR